MGKFLIEKNTTKVIGEKITSLLLKGLTSHSHVHFRDRDAFCQTILFLCEHHRVYLCRPGWHSLPHIWAIWQSLSFLCYRPVRHVTMQNNTRLNPAPERVMQSRDMVNT